MFGFGVKPYARGIVAYKKGVPSSRNPYFKGDRWYEWRQGWRKAELEAIVAKKGTCAGAHAGDDLHGKICDMHGPTWISLNPGTSAERLGWAPIQCTVCGEIWSMEWGGYTHERNMEAARRPELGHSFPKVATTCTACGISDSPLITTPCTAAKRVET